MLISPTEPAQLRLLGRTSPVPERHGCDFMVLGKRGRLGIQRKQFPGDLLSSLADGRLYQQVHMMDRLASRVLIVEGYGKWDHDGRLLDIAAFTRNQLHGLLFSLAFEFGLVPFVVKDMDGTREILTGLDSWWKKESHQSLQRRPGPAKTDGWGQVTNRDFGLHLLQSFPGIGSELAGRMWDHFKGVPIRWDVEGPEALAQVSGIGKGKAEKMWAVLAREGGNDGSATDRDDDSGGNPDAGS